MKGRLRSIQLPFREKNPLVSFEIEAQPESLEQFQGKDLDITIKQYRKKRSLDANACLWGCIGKLAEALDRDNWSMYLFMLQRYGKFTHIWVKPEAVEAVRLQWRETKIVGETIYEGQQMVEMICFFGSSTYDSKEFSRLLDGVISDMRELHLETPADDEMRAMIADMERREQRDKARRSEEARQSVQE